LLVVAALNGDAYGVNIVHEISRQTSRDTRLNQVHASLHRLEEKGMISSHMSEPTAERGGRRKRLLIITAYGAQTLKDIQTVRTNLWNTIPSTLKISKA
jgi:DNA-binding PadR family transcriptional regulator